MTDADTPEDADGEQSTGWQAHPEADDFLALLVQLANTGLGLPVTLTVPGGVVTGTLCSGATYFRGVGEKVTSAWPDDVEVPEYFSDIFENRAKDYEVEGHPSLVSFVHLRDAQTYLSTDAEPIPTGKGLFWRGQLRMITGFSLGAIEKTRT